LAGEQGGIQYVIDRKLDATFLYPSGGDIAIDVAWKILSKLPYDKINSLQSLLIDTSNASTINHQTAKRFACHNAGKKLNYSVR
jgi:hypothetical protein